MGFFRKKHDPISDKARALNEQIDALEAEIQRLSAEAEKPQPRFRSSAVPSNYSSATQSAAAPEPARDHFEEVDHTPLKAPNPQVRQEHYNELGVRKYDLMAALDR